MSEYDDFSEQREPEGDDDRRHEETPEASVQLARWSPWIWLIPAIAIFFATYLVVRYGFLGGGDVTVRFVDARGLDRYSPVRYRGAKVGTVQRITINNELEQVVVRISLDSEMKDALREGTRFWIVEPGLESGGLGGILSGTYVGIAPGSGERTRDFEGDEYPPILAAPEPGKTFILETEGIGSLGIGAPVHFQGVRVGRVLGAEYHLERGLSYVHVFVAKRFAGDVRQNTRFWQLGGLSLSLEGGGLSMGDASIASLLTPGVSFYTPDLFPGPPVPDGTRFELHESRAAAIAAADGPHLTYLTFFPGAVGGLSPGTPVQMKGVRVGHVREVRLRYLAETASLETPVTLEIDPRRLELDIPPPASRDELRDRMNGALQNLVQKGMRATLSTSLILPGASAVSLEMAARPGTGSLNLANDPPIIPTSAGGDGLEGALASINDIANRIRSLPIEEITGDLRSAARRLDTLVHDPRLDQSLQTLDRALTDIEAAASTINENAAPIAQSVRNAAESAESAAQTIEATAETARDSVEPIAASLRRAADSAEAAAARVEELMGSSVRQNYDLGELVKELTRAAEAVRALASYLTENPDSLLKGRRE